MRSGREIGVRFWPCGAGMRRLAPLVLTTVTILAVLAGAGASGAEPGEPAPPTPPVQPPDGPGGALYAHRSMSVFTAGEGDLQYWAFEPSEPRPYSAPLLLFVHGWGAIVPDPYLGWIEHLVRRGNVVVYPRYQTTPATPPPEVTRNALQAVQSAIRELQSGDHVAPRLDQVAAVGHSLGGVIVTNLASMARSEGIPPIRALMVVQPGDPPDTSLWFARSQPSILGDCAGLPAGMLMLVVAGDEDRTVGENTARRIYACAANVPPENRNYVLLRSDRHGTPALVANHYAPLAMGRLGETGAEAGSRRWLQEAAVSLFGLATGQPDLRVGLPDALDFYGFWKLFDGLTDAAFYLRHREHALGGTAEQRFMGTWSDGTAVRPPDVLLGPPTGDRP